MRGDSLKRRRGYLRRIMTVAAVVCALVGPFSTSAQQRPIGYESGSSYTLKELIKSGTEWILEGRVASAVVTPSPIPHGETTLIRFVEGELKATQLSGEPKVWPSIHVNLSLKVNVAEGERVLIFVGERDEAEKVRPVTGGPSGFFIVRNVQGQDKVINLNQNVGLFQGTSHLASSPKLVEAVEKELEKIPDLKDLQKVDKQGKVIRGSIWGALVKKLEGPERHDPVRLDVFMAVVRAMSRPIPKG